MMIHSESGFLCSATSDALKIFDMSATGSHGCLERSERSGEERSGVDGLGRGSGEWLE